MDESKVSGRDQGSDAETDSHINEDTPEEAGDSAAAEVLESSEETSGEEDQDPFMTEASSERGTESSPREDALVSIVTADFAMQNVILQLGLQLVSPDGRRIRRISRWALRCSACFKVTKVSCNRLQYVDLCRDVPNGEM